MWFISLIWSSEKYPYILYIALVSTFIDRIWIICVVSFFFLFQRSDTSPTWPFSLICEIMWLLHRHCVKACFKQSDSGKLKKIFVGLYTHVASFCFSCPRKQQRKLNNLQRSLNLSINMKMVMVHWCLVSWFWVLPWLEL